jgi:hypothetical protein
MLYLQVLPWKFIELRQGVHSAAFKAAMEVL